MFTTLLLKVRGTSNVSITWSLLECRLLGSTGDPPNKSHVSFICILKFKEHPFTRRIFKTNLEKNIENTEVGKEVPDKCKQIKKKLVSILISNQVMFKVS